MAGFPKGGNGPYGSPMGGPEKPPFKNNLKRAPDGTCLLKLVAGGPLGIPQTDLMGPALFEAAFGWGPPIGVPLGPSIGI